MTDGTSTTGDLALVSVIVPTFNSAKTIALCIESVVAQTYPGLETIVVDDGSTDQTPTIARRYGCTVLELAGNMGPATARNHGIKASSGSILFFLDSDVALAPDAVEAAMRIFEQHPDYAGVWGVYGATPLVDDGIVERVQVLHAHYRQIRKAGAVTTGHFAVGALRRRVVEEIGGFDERLAANANEDTEYGFRIAERYPMIFTPLVVGYHDDDDRIASILKKYFRRASSLVPLFMRQRGLRPGRETNHPPQQVAAAFLATASSPLPLFSLSLMAVPLAFLSLFVIADLRVIAFFRRHAGWRLVLPYVLLHYLYSVTIAAAAVTGGVRCLVDPRFRKTHGGALD